MLPHRATRSVVKNLRDILRYLPCGVFCSGGAGCWREICGSQDRPPNAADPEIFPSYSELNHHVQITTRISVQTESGVRWSRWVPSERYLLE